MFAVGFFVSINFPDSTTLSFLFACAKPVVSISKLLTKRSSGLGSFTSFLSGLRDGTIYYVRAYATNSLGTAYGNEVSFTTMASAFSDIDGNGYSYVNIGTQTWMVQNLRTTKYNDGTPIPLVTNANGWSILTSGAYCFYNNDETTNKSTYGALYNWYAVNSAKLAPVGWHVPTDADWTTLNNYLSANSTIFPSVAKALSATTKWSASTNAGAIGNDLTKNNSTGFSALPGGYRKNEGSFYLIGNGGQFWTSTESNSSYALNHYLFFGSNNLTKYSLSKSYGFSVRCVRD